MKTVAIIEGWAGGQKLSRLFVQQLIRSGFQITKDLGKADIVIAHSTGCFVLPNTFNTKLMVHINPPYWPGESLMKRWIKMNKEELKFFRQELGLKRYLSNKLWEIYYIFAKPSFTWSVLKNQNYLKILDKLSYKKMILIRNKNDEFCSPEIETILSRYKNAKYKEVEGYHSDYYINPKPYIDLVLREL